MTYRETRLRFLCFAWIPLRSWFLWTFNRPAAMRKLDEDMRAVERMNSERRWRKWQGRE